ncbi:MAG: hypothetical protein A2365_02185 [Candidatus Nealsonbacteria bacterium RIFOXYB1_FULL_40_15]|uniref:methionine--tRNA ligase n=2 Tax=Candidatus Nealsoniibacteriota TaxID=1817911 RepID=A0A1G2ESE3_9BACT|nr:MAG: hypothetical protein A2365_02185 [Candidatus Nealsonbacteria bacterium RIFOXYB1_FULL_40_15]OGZ28463.1 MAG: hypothetical protein A2562_03265 [Candidatus Nealsonbacteria bacterium RIFOXYD1_FULL_39_11]OGZ28647.1 MAG: hypothetical protein A2427_04530 [Candidatus Nealsonbacteria bacterium RIFOXYC1_FULL_40_7]
MKYYITTSIPYANAFPHIGFALEIVQADVLARYNREGGKEVFFLTGTDEHGLKIKKAAEEKGLSAKEFTDQVSGKFRELCSVLNISNTDFIRTTDEKRHKPAVEEIWEKMVESGDIYKRKYKGYYCSGCEAFVTEKDLVDGKCPNHQKEPEFIEEENYFFRLSKYLPELKKRMVRIIPESRKKEVLGYIKNGIEDVSFSRSKDKYFGFEVPQDPSQYLYVWADALLNYVSGIGYSFDKAKFNFFWPADVHCIGKDILKFHALIWPAMLLSLGLEMPKSIFVHGFITSEGKKMSKSLGNVVDPFEIIEKYGSDALRYYLLREIPSAEDGDFSIERFKKRYDTELASGIGNLVSRVEALKKKTGFGKTPSGIIKKEVKKAELKRNKAVESFKFGEALKSIWELISFCDKYIEENRPWEGGDNADQTVSDLNFAVDKIGELVSIFLPESSEKIKNRQTPLFPRI